MKNKTEQKAMEIVMKYEKEQGRKPENVSYSKRSYDIKSKGRQIEVKGHNKIANWCRLNDYNMKAFYRERNYYLYIVFVNSKEILILNKNKVGEKLASCKISPVYDIKLNKEDKEEKIIKIK